MLPSRPSCDMFLLPNPIPAVRSNRRSLLPSKISMPSTAVGKSISPVLTTKKEKKKGNPRGQWSVPVAGHPHEPKRIISRRRIRPAILDQSRISKPPPFCCMQQNTRSTSKGFSVVIDIHHASNLQILLSATGSES